MPKELPLQEAVQLANVVNLILRALKRHIDPGSQHGDAESTVPLNIGKDMHIFPAFGNHTDKHIGKLLAVTEDFAVCKITGGRLDGCSRSNTLRWKIKFVV